MTAIAEFTLPSAAFPLGRIFETKPHVTLELDRVVPSGDTVMPYFWVVDSDGDFAGIQAVFAELPELRSAECLVDMGERGLFRAEWEPTAMGIMEAIAASGVTVLAANGDRDGWRFEVRAMEGDQLSAFQDRCGELGVDVSLSRLRQLSDLTAADDFTLTDHQREALTLAYAEGYYDDPRAVDQSELADQLGISRQAVASRMRRGYKALIEQTICPDGARRRS
jgi:predicted DNA binding protein